MSFYTDWFIAEESQAQILAEGETPWDIWPSLSLRGIGEIDLMALWGILEETARGASVSDKFLYQGAEEGPFVVRVAERFVYVLANVEEAHLRQLAVDWSATEGLAGSAVDDLAQSVERLCAFARQAHSGNKPVLSLFSL